MFQFIVEERDKHASNAQFWAKFSDAESGAQFGFTQILTLLKRECAQCDARDAADALRCFDGNLDHLSANGAFNYTSKKGRSVVMTKASDIARNWRHLLAQDPSVAMLWSSRQAN